MTRSRLFATALATSLLGSILLPITSTSSQAAPAVVTPAAFSLTVTVEGVRSDKGRIMAQLMRSDDAKAKPKTLAGQAVPAANGKVILVFAGLPAGSYAVQMFHDEDGNGEMKTNMFGIPSEGFAFSNRAKASFGPPSFDVMKVDVKADTTTTAVMAY